MGLVLGTCSGSRLSDGRVTNVEHGHSTPEGAARGHIPARFARVFGLEVRGDQAVVLLGTNEPPDLYPYEVHVHREAGVWFVGSSSNGPGWSLTAGGGVVSLWEQMRQPEDASEVFVECRGRRHVVPVRNGYFLFVDWDYPDDDMAGWPRIIERR